MTDFIVFYLLLLQERWFLSLNAGLSGLIIGSFATVLIHRLPRILAGAQDLSLSRPASHCPRCKERIPFYVNVPVIGYLISGGKCLKCREPISPFYPLTELSCMFLALFASFLWGADGKTVSALLLLCGLWAASMIDVRSGYLPDEITLGLLWIGLISNAFGIWVSAADAIWGAFGAYGILAAVNGIYKSLRHKDGMGGGDMKLFAALGAFFGWQALLPILLVASVAGSCFVLILLSRQRIRQITFGPFLALAALIYMIGIRFFPFFLYA